MCGCDDPVLGRDKLCGCGDPVLSRDKLCGYGDMVIPSWVGTSCADVMIAS